MKLLAVSDLHGNLPQIPEGDLLMICGDIVPLNIQVNGRKSRRWFINDFYDWIEALPVKKVLFIAGNHDFQPMWDEGTFLHSMFDSDCKATYLQDEMYEYEGLKIYGTPWCKLFGNWAFMLNEQGLADKFDNIPEGLDILMTHDAPFGINDICMDPVPWSGEHIGNPILRAAILNKNPKTVLHGHLHSTLHEFERLGNSKVRNVSLLNEDYKPTYPITELNEEMLCLS